MWCNTPFLTQQTQAGVSISIHYTEKYNLISWDILLWITDHEVQLPVLYSM